MRWLLLLLLESVLATSCAESSPLPGPTPDMNQCASGCSSDADCQGWAVCAGGCCMVLGSVPPPDLAVAPDLRSGCGVFTECNGACVNLPADPNNCGVCGMACLQPPNGSAACVNGRCVV